MNNPFKRMTKREWALWFVSIAIVVMSNIMAGRVDALTLTATCIGVTSLIFAAQGNVWAPILMTIFCIQYAIISYRFRYWGEMFTYLFMSLPMSVWSIVTWLKNARNSSDGTVEIRKITRKGAGVLVLEELEHAKARGAKIYAEIVGYSATSDSYHITSPAPEGEGGARAMKLAMEDAKIEPKEITYINAHGTSTHLNDSCETAAIKTALGDYAKDVMVSSTKGNTGHLLGAAGGVEAVICVKAIEDKFIPPTINYKVPDEECDLDIVPNEGRNIEINYAMSNSLGFGGHNATIILKKW